MRPIDELNNFLDKLMRNDLNAKIDGTTGDHNYDMTLLKKSMSRLQTMLKVTEPAYVESQYGISYVASALELFEEMGNQVASAKCYKQIGLFDLRDGRFRDALRALRKAFKVYLEFNSKLESMEITRLMVECLMQIDCTKTEYEELTYYLEDIRTHSSNVGNLVQAAKADLELARVFVKQGKLEEAEGKVAESRLSSRRVSVENLQSTIEEHTLLVQALIWRSRGQNLTAVKLLTSSITSSPQYDPLIRYHSLKLLTEIFASQSLHCPSLNEASQGISTIKDIVVVLDCSEKAAAGYHETCSTLREFLAMVCSHSDRVGLVSANSHVVLSKGLSRIKSISNEQAFSELEWAKPGGDANLPKAIELALKLLDTGAQSQPDFNSLLNLVEASQPVREQWLLVLASSLERGRVHQAAELLR